jgi:Cof subfamily protein (haloacid dehalogenase superfamily)
MKYKLICIDIDGTLLNSKRQVGNATKISIQKARALGVNIVLSTGRIYTDAVCFADLIGINSAVIAANGAYIKVRDKAEVIFQSVLGADLAVKVLDICKRYRVAPHFYTAQTEYHGNCLFNISMAWNRMRTGMKQSLCMTKRKYIPSRTKWLQIIDKEKDSLVKAFILNVGEPKLGLIREEFLRIKELEVTSSGSNNIELNCKGITKGKGVEILSRYYNLKPQEIMVIGDSENDLSMFEYAGLSVAMSNASDIVKQKADYVTVSNDRDGVAKVIEDFVLKPINLLTEITRVKSKLLLIK